MSMVTDAVGGLFGMSKPVAPPAPPPIVQAPPTIEDTYAKAQQDSDALRKRQGSAANILAGGKLGTGDGGAAVPQTATKSLLGS